MSPANRRKIPVAIGRRVRQRARYRCGYCLCSEALLGMPMEFDHLGGAWRVLSSRARRVCRHGPVGCAGEHAPADAAAKKGFCFSYLLRARGLPRWRRFLRCFSSPY